MHENFMLTTITPQQQYHMPLQHHFLSIPPLGRRRGVRGLGGGHEQGKFMQGYGPYVAHLHTTMPHQPQQTMAPTHMIPQRQTTKQKSNPTANLIN